jgi:hypothetical protein
MASNIREPDAIELNKQIYDNPCAQNSKLAHKNKAK